MNDFGSNDRLVLIVEDNPANLLLTRAVLRRAGFRTSDARNAEDAQLYLRFERPDVILMDIQLPGMDGLTFTRALKADPKTAHIPIVALTAHAMAVDQVKARAAGCIGYLTKPIDVPTFAHQLIQMIAPTNIAPETVVDVPEDSSSVEAIQQSGDSIIESQSRTMGHVVVIDDHPENVALIRAQLERAGYSVGSAANGTTGLEEVNRSLPHLILLDVMMPGIGGFEVCRRLKADPRTHAIPVLMLTALHEQADKIKGLDAGADDFLSKPVDYPELLARVRSLIRQKRLYDDLAQSRDEIALQAGQIAAEQMRTKAILTSMSDGVVTTDLDGRVTMLNPGAEIIADTTIDVARGLPWREVFNIRDETGGPAVETVGRFEVGRFENGLHPGRDAPAFELQLKRPDGHTVDLGVTIAPIRQAEGEITGSVVVLRDMTPSKNAERRLRAQHAVSRVLSDATTLESVAIKLLESICENLDWQFGAIWRLDSARETLICVDCWSSPSVKAESLHEFCSLHLSVEDAGLLGRAWQAVQPLTIADSQRKDVAPRSIALKEAGLSAGFWFPIRSGSRLTGMMEFFSRDVRETEIEMQTMMGSIGEQIGQFIGRVQAVESLRTSQEQLRAVISRAPIMLFAIERNGTIIFSNGNGLLALGVAPDQRLGQSIFEIYHESPDLIACIRQALSGETSSTVTELGAAAFDLYCAPMRDTNGEITGCFGIAMDITDRKRAEDERGRLLVAVESQRATLDTVMSSMSDGLILVVDEGTIRFCNARAGEYLRVEPSELAEQSIHTVMENCALIAVDPKSATTAWKQALATTDERPRFEFSVTSPKRRDLEFEVFPVTNPGGDSGFGLLVRDVTRGREAERMKDELVSVVSHELRTPLASVVGFAELLLIREFSEDERREFVTIIREEGIRLTALINDFLDIQRMESDRQSLILESIDVRNVVNRAALLAGEDRERPIELEMTSDLPPVLADADRIHQVLINLISNARKFSPLGGKIRVRVKAMNSDVELSVLDAGLGIPSAAIPYLFDKFYRVVDIDRQSIKGTGLGLAICKQIVQAHGGRIWAESGGSGNGSTFAFTLPIAKISKQGGDVLIVEDDPGFARLVEKELEIVGLTSLRVHSAEAALE